MSDTVFDHAPGYAAPRALERTLLPSLAFLALLLLIFVGLDAFSPPLPVAEFGGVKEASHGDAMRQAAYLGTAGLILLCALQRHGMGALRAIPAGMALLLIWCLASAFWAPEPHVVLRRAGLEVVIVSALLLSVATIGAQRAFTIWRWLLAAILLVNFLSIPLIPAARHAAGELDPALVGNWRGLYGHKNIAGAVCAITAILFLFTKTGWRNCIGIAIAAAACVFLAMTHSKSSAGFLAVALAAGGLYRVGWRDGLSRAILLMAVGLLALGAGIFLLLDSGLLTRALADPSEFTGRAAIWAAELRYIADHPLLGAGFGTFADTARPSPLSAYVSGSWVTAVSHGHNGYLQVLVTVGGIGFALAMLALVAGPLGRFWALDWDEDAFKPMLFALFVFLVLHNVMESDFLEGDGVAWAALLLVIAALNAPEQRYSLRSR